MQTSLEKIVDEYSFDDLPKKWQDLDCLHFSKNKKLFIFQQMCLHNTLKALYLFYIQNNGDKKSFFTYFENNELGNSFDYDLNKKQEIKSSRLFLDYEEDYPVINNTISFQHFINRMSFWMATGSGKTLIIVKLIELLGKLKTENEIPKKDILFLAHREDLLEQFKTHVDEFNSYNFDVKIRLVNLKDFEITKRQSSLPHDKNEIIVFYYKSDLLSDEQKENIVNYKNYDNNGEWYILLDEAHKGDREDSKRQIIYSILSRKGFLFNFSATFTDKRDYETTCIFNFNLSKFIEGGYGKHIYISESEVTAFRDNGDFSIQEKQKIIVKVLILLTYTKKYFERIRKVNNSLYHRPLLLTLVNTVDTEDADLKLFFSEIEKIAKNEIDPDLFETAKQELISEIKTNPFYLFEEELSIILDIELMNKVGIKDILKQIFNSELHGNIEVLVIPNNKQELIFKLQTAEKPFAMIKIGDISGWLKEKLRGYEINESFDNESLFKKINEDDSLINILMGSRSFYEGWDSNRPNLLLFVNIGVGSDAKKFVLQSVGRGVRIEPLKNMRKRLLNLFNTKEIDETLFKNIRKYVLPIESLFIFGTKAENLKEIIKALKEQKQEKNIGDSFSINEEAEKHLLLIPTYKVSDIIFAEEKEAQKYPISASDFEFAKSYSEYLEDKIILMKYECPPKIVKITQKSLFEETEKNRRYDFTETRSINDAEIILNRIIAYFQVNEQELDNFKILDNEIIHFKRIKFSGNEKFEELKSKILEMKEYPKKQKELDNLYGKISREEFIKKQNILDNSRSFELNQQKVNIKYLTNHYYLPVIVSEEEKVEYINHIIDVKSEVNFIKQLENYLQIKDNLFNKFDWWMFSKLDHSLDEVFIPYYNPKGNKIAKFKPDFIFWMQKENQYLILFVDPKGTENTDGLRKIDGYRRLFENKAYTYNDFSIKIKILLKPSHGGIASVPEKYRKYWFDNFDDFRNKIL